VLTAQVLQRTTYTSLVGQILHFGSTAVRAVEHRLLDSVEGPTGVEWLNLASIVTGENASRSRWSLATSK